MQKHIAKNFRYPEDAEKMSIQGRVSALFVIDKDGNITDVHTRGPHPLLEKETVRIINKLPKMTPGKQRGKTVRVPFSIPIKYKLEGSKIFLIDSLDTEPKFLDYSFLNSAKHKKFFSTESTLKECINRHIARNFRYPEAAHKQKVQGRVEIEIFFSKDGDLLIRNITGEHDILNNEAQRIMSLLPKKVIAGIKDEKPVDSSIIIPINFKLR